MLSGEATNTNFIVFGLTRTGSNPRSTTVESSTLTFTPSMRLIVYWILELFLHCDIFFLVFQSIFHIYLSQHVYISHLFSTDKNTFVVLFLLTCGSLYYSFSEEKIVFVKLWCLLVSSTYIMYLRNFLCCTHINALIQLAALSINDIFRQPVLLQSIYSL
jgi:hypothetical protein